MAEDLTTLSLPLAWSLPIHGTSWARPWATAWRPLTKLKMALTGLRSRPSRGSWLRDQIAPLRQVSAILVVKLRMVNSSRKTKMLVSLTSCTSRVTIRVTRTLKTNSNGTCLSRTFPSGQIFSKSGLGAQLKDVMAQFTSRSLPSSSRQSFTQASKAMRECTSSTGVSKAIVDSGTSAREMTSTKTWLWTKALNGDPAPETSMIFGPKTERMLIQNIWSS